MTGPIFQYMLQGQQSWGTRLFADGQVEEYSNTHVEFDEEKGFVQSRVPYAWRLRAQLKPSEVAQVLEAIEAAGFFDLPTTLSPEGEIDDGRQMVWAVTLDDRSHTVTDHTRHPALEQLRQVFEGLVGQALSRD
jgi:hypothetical protein